MSKLQIISDKNKKSSNIKNLLLKKINNHQFKKDNLVIVIGGDGFMLEILKKNKKSKKQSDAQEKTPQLTKKQSLVARDE